MQIKVFDENNKFLNLLYIAPTLNSLAGPQLMRFYCLLFFYFGGIFKPIIEQYNDELYLHVRF